MKGQAVKSDDFANHESSSDSQESSNKISLTTKLERRRRIEELNEERRLQKELCEF